MSARSFITGEPIAFDERLPSTDEKDPLYRLRVTQDYPDDLITIAEESLTSTAPTAEATGIRGALDLTTFQAEWLYLTLGRLLGKVPPPATGRDTDPSPVEVDDGEEDEDEHEDCEPSSNHAPTMLPEAWTY